jgi:Tol biopolymer transport system component
VRIRVALAFISLVSMLVLVAPANAAFPGVNGKIAFYSNRSGNNEIYTIDPDGNGLTQITNGSSVRGSGDPKWSPDGKKFVFHSATSEGFFDVFTMNADGTNQVNLTNSPTTTDGAPGWSPDGRKIVFASDQGDCGQEIYTMDADGTGVTRLTCPDGGMGPAWSPDGTKIAYYTTGSSELNIFVIDSDGSNRTDLTPNRSAFKPSWSPDGSKIAFVSYNEIYTMNADGTNQTRLTNNSVADYDPAWSPDGRKIAFISRPDGPTGEVMTMNADGTDVVRLTNDTFDDVRPDWQPLPPPGPGFARPKGATPFQTYFTVAYKPCSSPNEQHGAPLAVPSCSPPQQTSDYATVGTLDANDQQAKSVGSVRLDVKQGNPATSENEADVKVAFSEKDIRNKSDLTPYLGELFAEVIWHDTDHWNAPIGESDGTQPGTAQDLMVPLAPGFGVQCTPNPVDPTAGSSCQVTTTLNAVVTGMIREGKRMNVELPKVDVYDGGADGDANTTDDNTLFLTEGIFVP